ncbi:hypothetical protein TpMuguga_03g00658 [Theileria parva strain Muguga]|uniref:RanBP2-type domain-containing protein n=1 Tax=Theileria parva TaxID=5875 RepID=Q4MZ33_THEPA|nr:uncharacterized protein TpMuguga_03g00658 [Theileria parva strain Muguga]EAN30499.1 hypothetical protein TpMuguga_03g00658 [Theileria parva strain Muguga]|eukprot:XP_762782.1 hypothetical protein [Theileria parva strain Muguga]
MSPKSRKSLHKDSHNFKHLKSTRSSSKIRRSRRSRSTSIQSRDSRGDKYTHKSRYRTSRDPESVTEHLRLAQTQHFDPVTNSDLREEFERSAFDKAYGLDISEILTATTVSEGSKLSRSDRRRHREHELKHHQERFWKCKRCEFMNYLSNYECKHCKTLRHTSHN